jgi:type I restriction enzyme M protein
MSQNTPDIVVKLWSFCDVLRDDGITYHQYVTELTYLLFLKMAKETGAERFLPDKYRWTDLEARTGRDQLLFYRDLLNHLGRAGKGLISQIYANASTSLQQPKHLNKLVTDIDDLDWYCAKTEGLGNLYEGLLEKNASEKKSGAGQYFTPRPLIDCMVDLMQPQAGEIIQDPAAGTCGFLISADRYIKERTDQLFKLSPKKQTTQRSQAYVGVELVPDTQRLALMNLMLHDIEGTLHLGDSLSSLGKKLPQAHLILTNPPFGTKKGGGKPSRDDFTYATSNKQLAFLQHIYRGLKPGGRAAVVLPDNVLFESGLGKDIRTDLMAKCDLHTILRLPTGIFYAQGVKTNVLFFNRGQKDKNNTKYVWIYDARTNAPAFGKRTPFTRKYLKPFETVFGNDPLGHATRVDQGPNGRWRRFSREDIAQRENSLDLTWLKDDSQIQTDQLLTPEVIAAQIMKKLKSAIEEMNALTVGLTGKEA